MLISNNVKTSKLNFFSGAALLEPKGKREGLQHHPIPNSPLGKLVISLTRF